MKLRIRNTLLLVFHTFAFGLLFFPPKIYPMYNLDLGWGTFLDGHKDRIIEPLDFFHLVGRFEITPWSQALAIVVFILFFVVFLALLLQLIGKNDRQQNSIFALILSVFNLFAFFWYSFFLTKAAWNEHRSLELGDLFFIELLLLVVSVVFYVITYVLSRRNSASS